LTAPFTRPPGPGLYALAAELREVMWQRAGLVRDADGLQAARAAVDRIERALDAVGVAGDPALNTAWQDWLNLRNQTLAARLIVGSALERRESRGAHFRRDFPAPSPPPLVSLRVQRGVDGPTVRPVPVEFTRAVPRYDPSPWTVPSSSAAHS
jgi:succinate dehydrogenase/fumarate reductase flavoprotein subunit